LTETSQPFEIDIKPDKKHKYDDHKIRRNCIGNYLQQEVKLHKPKVIFVFGDRGMKILSDEPWIDSRLLVYLTHYAYQRRANYPNPSICKGMRENNFQ
jgi:hypothetical protein